MKQNKIAAVLKGLKVVDVFTSESYIKHVNRIVFDNGLVIPVTYEMNDAIKKFLRTKDKAQVEKQLDLYDYINLVAGTQIRWFSDKRKGVQRLKPTRSFNNQLLSKVSLALNTLKLQDGIEITAAFETLNIPRYRGYDMKKKTYQELIIRTNIQPSKIIITL